MSNNECIPPRDCWLTLRPGESIRLTPELASDLDKQTLALRQIRGNIIALTVEIEFAIDVLMRELLFSHDWEVNQEVKEKIEAGRGVFDHCISKSGSLTFNNKISIIRNLLSEYKVIDEIDRKQLFKLLAEVRVVRNTFAHTTMAFEPRADESKISVMPYLIKNGTRIYLNNEYFDKLNMLYSECLIRIENITRTIQKVPLQPLPDDSMKPSQL